jgi:hypothetical protein
MLLRSRRGGTEEPEEPPREGGRKTSLLLRTRKLKNEEEDESRLRAPSRATTEVNSFRTAPRELSMTAMNTQTPTENPPPSSVLPRRNRMIPSIIATRFATSVAGGSTPTTPGRKYLERSTHQDRGTPLERSTYLDRGSHQERGHINSSSERLAEERGQPQRHIALGQTPTLNRTSSLGRRTTRDSGIPSLRS